jgi:hypothetical protein
MIYQGSQHSISTPNHAAPHATAGALISVMALALVTLPALAEEPKDSAATPRQVAHCMMKRLRADRTESYRDAFKGCKHDLEAASPREAGPDRGAASAMNASNQVIAVKQD